MGVDSEVLPTSEREARRLMDMIASTEAEPDDDSRRLTQALFAASGNPPEGGRPVPEKVVKTGQGLIRGILGPELADQLGVPDHRYKRAFPIVRSLVRRTEAITNALPASLRATARARAIGLGRDYWAMLTRGSREPFGFAPPERLLGIAGDVVRSIPHAIPRRVSPLASAMRSK
jgi:hypothetical protein